MIRWLAPGALVLLLAGPASPAARPATRPTTRPASGPPEARLLMSWGAPYGRPGARDNVDAACDSSLVDTLYLSMDPGRDAERFVGITATLYFRAPEGQTLSQFWKIADMNARGSPLRLVFDPDPARGFNMPWNSPGLGQGMYDFVSGSGRIRMIYAVASTAQNPVKAGRAYGIARILVRHPGPDVDGCGQPMCVEWFVASLAFAPADEAVVNRGSRFVSLNSPGGAACRPSRETLAPPPWHPRTPKP